MKKKEDYINYKLQKSAQSIKEAKLLKDNGMPDTAVSRLYYAAFYAVNALLVSKGFNPKTPAGAKTIFNKEFILTQKLKSSLSDFYTFIMAKRFEADYDDFVFIDMNNIDNLFTQTESFINEVVALISKD
jgi:uncharacterized protein